MAEFGRHQYQPLPTAGHIRLLTIYPGSDDDIIVTLAPVAFTPESPQGMPVYEALSYTWDSEQNPQHILVREDDGSTAFLPVTRNLAVALMHLRYSDKARVIWIDALCINQSDLAEKGPQVAQMGMAYRLAVRVVTWLGPEQDDSTHALQTLTWIGSQVDANHALWLVTPSKECTDPSFGDLNMEIPLGEKDIRAIFHLISRRWFERLWVRQEIMLSEARTVVQCGLFHAAWPPLRRALLCLYMKRRPPSSFEEKLYDRLLVLRGLIGQPPTVELGFIRHIFGQAACKDPRDRVYALLEFLPEDDKAVVGEPDYTKDVETIFKNIMWRWIVRYRSLNLLTQCEPGIADLACSWIPDWSKKDVIFGRNYWRHFASSQLAALCTLSPDGRTLRSWGVSATSITDLQAIPVLKDRRVQEVEDVLRDLLPEDGLENLYPTGINMLEAYARTFIANAVAENEEPWTGVDPTVQDAKDTVLHLHNGKENEQVSTRVLGHSTSIFRIARAMLGGKQLLHGSGGYIGIAPRLARRGDEICVLVGCQTPMVLRRVGESTFRIVGECYVLGLSEGESLLGALPLGTRRVFATDPKWGIYSCFNNETTAGCKYSSKENQVATEYGNYLKD
ncbi:Heterokaryon incompatibility protein 6 OR allele [Lachnellula suecica]|uniref:Heterokaryon incompatibility protein 6 OR allele n=1 Tax=Lachnellula suecica TaxID=602035 RepID=A0A8T9BYP4_9HELO|nr:Heterokaryon incompatibility protein 6 OR allele [Lachnellula suecica]